MTKQDPLAGGEEITSKQVGFNKVGDWIKGTYVGKKEVLGKNGKVNLYELKGLEGEFHQAVQETDGNGNKITKVVEPGLKVVAGDYYQVWGGKSAIDDLFKKVKEGGIVGIMFKEATPSKTKGNSPFKVFKTVSFGADTSWMGENEEVISNDLPEAMR